MTPPRLLVAILVLLSGARNVASQGLTRAKPEDVGLSSVALARIAPALQVYVDSGKLAGVTAAVARHGKLAYLESVGWMDSAHTRPMQSTSVFRIYSMTKPIIAAAILQLADRGKLRVDHPVSKYIPAFADVKVYGGGSAAAPQLRPPDRSITLGDLLTHTAGFTYGFFSKTPVDTIYTLARIFDDTRTVEQFSDTVAHLPLMFSPGTGWNYSVGIDVLGRVIEVASGKPLDRYLEEEIFRPLGMAETVFHIRPGMETRLPTLFNMGRDGRPHASPVLVGTAYRPESKFLGGGGGLLSTVADYLRFAQMLVNGGELDGVRILRSETAAQMLSSHLPSTVRYIPAQAVGQGGSAAQTSAVRFIPAVALDQSGYSQGYGGAVLIDSAAANMPGPPGIYRWWGAAGTFFWIDPKNQLVGMVWTQLVLGRAYKYEIEFQRLVYAALK